MSPALRDGIVFQLGWLCCVAGGNRGALLAAVVLLPLVVLAALALGLAWWGERAGERRRRDTLVAWSFLGVPLLHLAAFSLLPVVPRCASQSVKHR